MEVVIAEESSVEPTAGPPLLAPGKEPEVIALRGSDYRALDHSGSYAFEGGAGFLGFNKISAAANDGKRVASFGWLGW